MNRKTALIILTVLTLLPIGLVKGQSSFSGDDLNSILSRGYEMYSKAKYATAMELFDKYLAANPDDLCQRSEAEYYSALSSLRIMTPDAEYKMQTFIQRNPESPELNQARFETGLYCYQLKDYKGTIDWLEQVDRLKLSDEPLHEYLFKLGYSHFMKGDKKRALMLFAELKDIDTDYTVPSIYYHACIAYDFHFYKTALEGFERLKGDETFGQIVPFYIVQIYYLDKNYDGILAMAPSLLEQAGKKRETELYRFIGDAYFQKGIYQDAIPYLEKFIGQTSISGRTDKYQLAYCYYQTDNFKDATRLFTEVVGSSDTLTQNSYYMLGSCYLKAGDKKKAQLAYSAAANMSFDKFIKEESMFNFAKLAYENSYAPFGEGIEALHKYIEAYPSSEHLTEAYDYLVSAYLKLKNYQAALKSLDRIAKKDDKLKEAYQRIAYYRGVELFRNKKYQEAIAMFDKSLTYKEMDRDIRAKTMYWKGEAEYALGNNSEAKNDWEVFRNLPGANKTSEYDLIDYNIGYLYFNDKEYQEALQYFTSFSNNPGRDVRSDISADARNRIADCYYIASDYPTAISYYDKVIDNANADADYAMFQKAFAQGLSNDNNSKVKTLTDLIEKYPKSAYVPNSYFERGRAYISLQEPSKGEADFNSIINKYPSSQFVPPAMVQLGLVYFNAGDNERAVKIFKYVIENYRQTPEARNAMNGLRNAYTEMNDVDSYFSYLKNVGGYENVKAEQIDSMTYIAGENLYVKGNCENAEQTFRNYISQFPQGAFVTNARFYLADCLNRSGSADEALALYNQVISVGNNQFMEQSLLGAASITFGNGDYAGAYSLYERLSKEASTPENEMYSFLGMMRAANKTGDDRKTIDAAEKVLGSDRLTEDIAREATFLTAKANQKIGNAEEALDDYQRVANEVSTAYGAESKYHVAELQFASGNIDQAEKTANEFVNMNSPHVYWTGKIFLLMSDIALKKNDAFQARATLQSLIDYYTGTNDGIIDEARAKLAALGTDEADAEKSNSQQPTE